MIDHLQPIETKRLVLRPFTTSDETDMFAFESREDVARYLYNEPRSPEDNTRELAARQTKTALRNQGDTLIPAIELDGTVIGYTVLTWLSRQHQQGEFGYVLHPSYSGQGYATEAAVEMLRLGFERLKLHRIIGRCDARNTASQRVMERLGLRKEAHFVGNEIFKGAWGEELVYAMLAAEWDRSPWK
ncbi:GNAT family N-acetyltransferase [Phytoactinopolyspora limicola]|uniref:GNAT family N-acetyltransferase n=1 Tax=Phytoactinopolyspora limicola TaxID=2715536 RepID=UPI001409A806|nr:GNAT family N-acetyltransferase [Phytoactinopolyspora limicola]